MTKIPFGKTGFTVSQLGFGAAPAAYLAADQDRAAEVINQLLDAGVNLIDTAASYPGSEAFLGERFSRRRGEFVLVSKCGQRIPESDSGPFAAATIAATVDRALRQLKTDHLDVMLLHSCDLKTLQKGEALGELVKARDAGKVKYAGYSGDNEAAAWAADQPEIGVIETSISIADQANIDMVLPRAKKNGIGILAKRPIANAAWKHPDLLPGMYKSYAKGYTERLAAMKLDPAELGFAGDADQAFAELALRFTLSQDADIVAIIGTTSSANAAANLRYADKGPLPLETVEKIRAAFHKADPDGKWTGQT